MAERAGYRTMKIKITHSRYMAMRTSISIPEELLEVLDRTWKDQELDSRSRAIRGAIREYVDRHTELENLKGDAVATVVFDYEYDRSIDDIHAIQHNYDDVMDTTHHKHRDDRCVQSIFCEGDASEICELVHRLRNFDAVGQVNVRFLRSENN